MTARVKTKVTTEQRSMPGRSRGTSGRVRGTTEVRTLSGVRATNQQTRNVQKVSRGPSKKT